MARLNDPLGLVLGDLDRRLRQIGYRMLTPTGNPEGPERWTIRIERAPEPEVGGFSLRLMADDGAPGPEIRVPFRAWAADVLAKGLEFVVDRGATWTRVEALDAQNGWLPFVDLIPAVETDGAGETVHVRWWA